MDVKVDNQFRVGMKLEARLNPSLICVATITDIMNNELLIHFDGWTNKYDYWCRPDTPDIHPIGWCRENRTKLQAPKGTYCTMYFFCLHSEFVCTVPACMPTPTPAYFNDAIMF